MSNLTKAKGKAEDVLKDAKELANETVKVGKEELNNLKSEVNDFSNCLAQEIRNRPLRSVLIAGAVGFLLAKCL